MSQNTYHFEFLMAAILLNSVNLFYYYTKKNIKNAKNTIFELMIWSSLGEAVTGLIGFNMAQSGITPFLVKPFIMLYYLFLEATIFYLLIYIVAHIGIKEKLTVSYRVSMVVPASIVAILTLASPITDWIFKYSVADGYQRGNFHIVFYLLPVVYFCGAFGFLVRNWNFSDKSMCRHFLFFTILCAFPSYIQAKNSYFLMESFLGALAVQLLLFTMNNQDELIDSQTKMMNKRALINFVEKLDYHRLPFGALLVRIADYDLMCTVYGIRNSESLINNIAQVLCTFADRGMSFSVSDSCFVLIVKDRKELSDMQNKIAKELEKAWQVDGIEIYCTYFITTILYPEKAKDVDSFFAYLTYFQKMKKQRYGIIPSDEITIKDKLREQEIEKAIRSGLENNNFYVVYQPICTTVEQKFVTAEVLIRLDDPELGPISPAEFVPIAEKNGMIIEIGNYVLEKVCDFIENHDMEALGLEYIEINLSVIQCLQRDFISAVLYMMKRHHIAAKYICFEITETAANCSPDTFTLHLEKLHQAGFELALDDFGTGYGNLQRLMSSPFSIVKIDKSTTEKVCGNEKLEYAMLTTFEILHKLGKKLVAEGVETKEQYELLKEAGCDYIQGYYFSRPIKEQEFVDFLNEHNF